VSEELLPSIPLLSSATAEGYGNDSFIVIVKNRKEFLRWLGNPPTGLEGIQVEGLIGDPEVWALAAQGADELPLDVVLDDPAREYSALYRLVDVRMVRPVRVTMPAKPGFLKALRLAASIQIPVRLLPGQPDADMVTELLAAANFYLRDSMVETPVEFFHSVFAVFRGMGEGTLWDFLEETPVAASLPDGDEAECTTCRWQPVCAGYFKWPDPAYACAGVKELFAFLESAAAEISRDLADCASNAPDPAIPSR
jgi:hypothetical protein